MKSPRLHEELNRRRPVLPWKQNSEFTFVESLKACAKKKDLYSGERLHSEVVQKGLLDKSPYVASVLIHMYAKCGALKKAQKLLEEFDDRDVVCWNALIAGYVQHEKGCEALKCFEKMREEGFSPDPVSFICILKACGNIQDVDKGIEIHEEVLNRRFLLAARNVMLGNALVDMYAKCGMLAKAQQVLEALPARNAVTWNTLIAGYAQHNQGKEALDSFDSMQREGFFPNDVTFTCILKACANIGALDMGIQIHDQIVRKGLVAKDDTLLWTAMVDMYAKCGELERAQAALDELSVRDVVPWSALIAGCIQQGNDQEALYCYERMRSEGLSPDAITFTSVLKACGSVRSFDLGKDIHEEVVRKGLLRKDTILGTALLDMYAKCGSMLKAQEVFNELITRNVVSWNALIAGYAQQGLIDEALDCFKQMQFDGFSPDSITLISILKACGSEGALDEGQQIHIDLVCMGLQEKPIELGNVLVGMYAKCNALAKAEHVLNDLPVRDVVSWNTLISAYTQHEQGEAALTCFEKMHTDKISPNVITFICILRACGSVGAIYKGKQLHNDIITKGWLEKHIALGNALLNMYAKCGDLGKAHEMFEELLVRDAISWNALMTGYVQQGQGREALDCFEWMQAEGLSPDEVTYLCVLKACSYSGFLDEGQEQFAKMTIVYGITPYIEHMMCMVYLFACAGLFDKALSQIKNIPFLHYPVWCALLGSCQKWGKVNLGRLSFELARKRLFLGWDDANIR